MPLKMALGILIGLLNIAGLVVTIIALFAVFIIAKLPRASSIYIMAATNLTIDLVQLLLGVIYLAPSIIANSFFFEGGRDNPYVVFLGSVFMTCWYYGSIAQILVAFNRLIVVCFAQHDFFTPRRVFIMMVGLYPLALTLSITAQYLLPCCNFSYNHIVLSYTYAEKEGFFNYSNAYIDLWMNSISSTTCFACYTVIVVYVHRMNRQTSDTLNLEQKSKRRMKEYSAISLFYLFSWVFFRVFPKYITAEDSLNWYSVISICVAFNCSANALVYLLTNTEVRNVVKIKIFKRGVVNSSLGENSRHSEARTAEAKHTEATLPFRY